MPFRGNWARDGELKEDEAERNVDAYVRATSQKATKISQKKRKLREKKESRARMENDLKLSRKRVEWAKHLHVDFRLEIQEPWAKLQEEMNFFVAQS